MIITFLVIPCRNLCSALFISFTYPSLRHPILTTSFLEASMLSERLSSPWATDHQTRLLPNHESRTITLASRATSSEVRVECGPTFQTVLMVEPKESLLPAHVPFSRCRQPISVSRRSDTGTEEGKFTCVSTFSHSFSWEVLTITKGADGSTG